MQSLVRKGRILVILSSLVAVLVIISLTFQFLPNSYKRPLITNAFVQHFIHAYHSLRKLPDIAFFPYWFSSSDLPIYDLVLTSQDLRNLEDALPRDPINGHLSDANRVTVKAWFITPDYQERVDVRYRGANANHWNSLQRSFKISFPSDNLFQGQRGLNLIIPSDRGYLIELLNVYRAKKFGLTTPELKLVRVQLNSQDFGVYLASEDWSAEWIERNELPTSGNLLVLDESETGRIISGFSSAGTPMWKSKNLLANETGFEEIKALNILLTEANDTAFAALAPHLIDLDKLYKWDIINILARSSHQTNVNNSVLYFNGARGKFEPIPWDIGFGNPTTQPYVEARTLEKRVLSIPQFRAERDGLLKNYLDNPKNLEDDLNFYDNLVKNNKSVFLKDNVKLDNNVTFLQEVNRLRTFIAQNFTNARIVLNEQNNDVSKGTKAARELVFEGNFQYLPLAVQSIDEFLQKHHQFIKRNASTIELLAGTHVFNSTIVIPEGLTVIINPGTKLLLQEKIFVLSYSPIIAIGNPKQPIVIQELHEDKPYAMFIVVDSQGYSRIGYVHVRGGSNGTINGVTGTTMLGFHGDNTAEIRNSHFSHTFHDDAINAKYGHIIIADSVFTDTFSDAIDLDYNDGIVERNTFMPIIGRSSDPNMLGDAIDVSFSRAMIRNNSISGCTDKGISVGERSQSTIEHNTIEHCPTGIAVKDQANAVIVGGKLSNNNVGISLYRKKDIFGGGKANIINVLLENNKENIVKDTYSTYEVASF